MDNAVLYAFMIVLGVLMFGFSFAFLHILEYLGAATLQTNYWSVFFTLLAGGALLMYFASAAAFSAVQYTNCKKIKAAQVFSNAAISTAISSAFTLLAGVLPFLRDIVKNLLPLDLNPTLSESFAFGYYNFWGAMFGVVVGGSFSAICPT
jgi:hypothetical protein